MGFRASGELTSIYQNVLVPAAEAALRIRDKSRLLHLLGDDVTGFSVSAAWHDTKVGMERVTRWEKIAVVTDQEWLQRSVNISGYLIRGEIKAFPAAEEGYAQAWARADLADSQAPGHCGSGQSRRARAGSMTCLPAPSKTATPTRSSGTRDIR